MDSDEKLMRLLALKRFERPAPGSLDNVVAEFHRRLRHEQIRRAQYAPGVLWARFMDALLLEPLALVRNLAAGAAVAAGLVLGLGTLSLTRPTTPITTVAQNTLRIDLEPSDEAAIRSLGLPSAEVSPLDTLAGPEFDRQLAQPLVPEAQATPVSFDEANIVF